MASSRGSAWRDAQDAERLAFLLGDLDERRRTIRVQAWHEGSWGAVYDEVTAMRDVLAEARAIVAGLHSELVEKARGA